MFGFVKKFFVGTPVGEGDFTDRRVWRFAILPARVFFQHGKEKKFIWFQPYEILQRRFPGERWWRNINSFSPGEISRREAAEVSASAKAKINAIENNKGEGVEWVRVDVPCRCSVCGLLFGSTEKVPLSQKDLPREEEDGWCGC